MPASNSPRLPCFAMLALVSLACAKGPPSGGVGTYRGVATGASEIGILEITVSESEKGPLPATGTLSFPSKSLSLTGSLDKSKTQLSLTSSDGYKLIGESRPDHAYGGFSNTAGDDMGSFAVVLQPADSTIELYCGSMISESDNDSKGLVLPLAITAIPGAGAICVGPNFTWSGGLSPKDVVICTATDGAYLQGDVNTGTGSEWVAGENEGSWKVAPCPSNGGGIADGGVPDSSPDPGAADAGSAN